MKFIEPFVASVCRYQVTIEKEKSIHVLASIPERDTSKGLLYVKEQEPDARVGNTILLGNYLGEFKEFAWYDLEKGTHVDLEPLFMDYLHATSDFMGDKKIDLGEFRKKAYSKWNNILMELLK